MKKINHSHMKTFQVLVTHNKPDYKTLSPKGHEDNIFRDRRPSFMGEERETRPIGGFQLIRKMELEAEIRSRKVSKGRMKMSEKLSEGIELPNSKMQRPRVFTELREERQKNWHLRVQSSIEPYE
jgi:hypothetical protein